ncbi:MAG: TOMM precursor leader peptide-binding protein [Byssovorax sp.]
MPCIRLSPSASVTRTDAGVILCSDLGTFQITGPDAGGFLDQMVPLLDGSRDQEALVQALAGYSRSSILAFLDVLKKRGLVEAVPEGDGRWRGPEEFFRAWSAVPAEAMVRLLRSRVLIVGLDPWGATAAIELAAAGIGALHLIDEGAVRPEDVALLRSRGKAALAATRRRALAALIGEQAPWCRVEESPIAALDATDAVIASGPWSLLVAAVSHGDTGRIERVARLAHRAGIVSLWSHLTGTTAVLGPLVTPGKTACRICATVEALNPPLAEQRSPLPEPLGSAREQLLGHMVAMEALRVLSGYAPSELGGRLLIEDFTTLGTSLHTLVRLPRCRVCGEGQAT